MGELTEIQRIQDELDKFYDQKTSFREKGKIRVLQMVIGEYESYDVSRYGFIYDVIDRKDTLSVLKKILLFKPDIMVAYDSAMRAREYYNHKNILYINDNDYGTYIYWLQYNKIPKNEIHFYNYRECHELFQKLYGDDSVYQHIVYETLTPGVVFLEQKMEIAEEFETDIVIVSGSNSSFDSTRKYIEGVSGRWMINAADNSLKEQLNEVLFRMLDIFYERMDKSGELIEDENIYIEEFWKLLGDSAEEFKRISERNKQYLFHLIRMLIGYSAFRRLVVKWIIESGYKVELWGDSWKREADVQKYYQGNIISREKLAETYNHSKICLFTNPAMGIHTSVFEMISSKSLCLAYQNDNTTVASLKDYFKDGESIVFFKSRKELLEKIEFYIRHADKRAAVINNGYQIIKNQNLYWEYQYTEAIEKAVELAKKNMGME